MRLRPTDGAPVDDVVVPVAQAADLVLLKLFAGGPQDLWDVAQLLEGNETRAVAADVESRLPALPAECARLWAQVARSR